MPATVFQLLEALPAHFASVAPSAAAAEQARKATAELVTLAYDGVQAGLSLDTSHLER